MDACIYKATMETIEYLIIGGYPFFGRNLKEFKYNKDQDQGETSGQACLNFRMWNKLLEELLIHICIRLPLKDIL